MAVENMTLMAVSLGLGTCVMGAPLEIKEDVNNYIGKEKVEGLELLCGIVLGWPDHNPPAAPRQTEGRITWIE
jgi:nitroreductase